MSMGDKKRLGNPQRTKNGIRWTRMLHGKRWTSPVYPSVTRDNEREAWALWSTRREEIVREHADNAKAEFEADPVRYDTHQQLLAITRVAKLIGDNDAVNLNHRLIDLLPKLDDLGIQQLRNELNIDDQFDPIQGQGIVLAEAHEALTPQAIDSHDTALLVEEWLSLRLGDVRAGEITVGTLDNYRNHLSHLVAFCPDIRNMTEKKLSEFRSLLQKGISEGASKYTMRDTLSVAKTFLEWCGDTAQVIEPLRTLRKRGTGISVPTKHIVVTWDDADIADLFTKVVGVQKLYYLLILNTGAYESDIGTWEKHTVNEKGKSIPTIDLASRTITFKRHKERNVLKVPTVTYRLWDETFLLLQAHISQHEGLLLTNASGTPLWVDEEKTNETKSKCKRKRINVIGRQFGRLKAANPNFGTLDNLRKTALTKLDDHNEYARYSKYFAGHSPDGVLGKFYVKPSQQQFDNAVIWLGNQFGFKSEGIGDEAQQAAPNENEQGG